MNPSSNPGADLSPIQRALLERLLERGPGERAPEAIPRVPAGARVPLGSAQARIWFVCRMYPASAEYNVLGPPLELTDDAPRARLEAALRALMARHDALRLRILEIDQAPVQEEVAGLAPPLSWHDLSELPAAEAERRAAELGHLAARTPFALDRAPLLRVTAVRLPGGGSRLYVVAHHIIVDGASMDVLYDELHALASDRALPPPPAARFLDHVAWERAGADEPRLSRQLAYWRAKLAGPLPVLDVPKDRPWIAVRDRRGRAVPCALPPAVLERARAFAAAEGVTLFVTLLAAYKALLLRLTGQTDLIVGTPLAGRDHPAAEGLVGSFARIVALRTGLGGRLSFRDAVRRVHATTVEAQDHQQVPFERIVAELKLPREPTCSPIFQTVFALHTSSGVLREPGAGRGAPAPDSETSKWELSLSLVESEREVSGFLEYAADLYDEPTIARYVALYTRLLANLVAAPDRALQAHPLLSAAERARLVAEAGAPGEAGAHAPPELADATLAAPFEAQARRTPDAVALAGEEGAWTYRELNERANRLAHLLRAEGVLPGGAVAVCMERSFALVAALYAIAKAGAAYAPIDPALPTERARFQLEDTGVRVVVTHAAARAKVPGGPWRTICLEDVADRVAAQPATELPCDLPASHLAYLMYTSGSTGRPKAVAFPVDAALSSVRWLQRCYPVREGDRHVLKTPFGFDVSLWELFWPLHHGGALVVCRPGGHTDPRYLAALIEQHQITSICFVPSMLEAFLDQLAPGRCRSLRWVHCGGEAMTPRLRDAFHARLGATLVNGCGPTETHAVAMTVIPPGGSPRVPIGRPVAAFRLHVLDEELEPRPVGVPGELYVGGEVGLAHGYHRRPALTAERFLPDPFGPPGARMYRTGDVCRRGEDGALEHLGRRDAQIKLLGVRIEPAEIEAVLCEHAAVRAAAVLAIPGDPAARLVGFVVPRGPAALDPRDVLQHAARWLPRHLIPASIVGVGELPTTPNGKIDREALVARWRDAEAAASPDTVAPSGELELRLKQIFEQVLGARDVSVTAGFFELGGHSLLIFKLLSACEQQLGVRLAASDLFAAPSVRELAARIGAAARAAGGSLVPLAPRQGKPLVVFLHAAGGSALPFLEVAGHLGPDYSVFAVEAPAPEADGRGPSIEELAARYADAVDAVRGLSPVILAGWSMGGCVALEMARRWQQRGVAVAALLLLDSWPPPGALEPAEREAWRRGLLEVDYLAHERALVGPEDARALERLARVLDANRRAFLAYQPGWFDGEIDYLRADEAVLEAAAAFPAACRSADRGWGRHVRAVTVHPVDGDHFTLVGAPHAASLARTIHRIAQARLAFGQI